VIAGGCGKSKDKGGAAHSSHVSGTPHTDAVVDAWKSAGLTPEGFALIEPPPYGASYCEQGRIQGVDALLCEYGDDASLERGQKQIRDEWARAGVKTGVALRTKHTLMAVVDRERRDPNGKIINQMVSAFRKL
jgi:hypothetical protein